jgi:hypothetical protein
MKRFLFWFLVALVAVVALHNARERRRREVFTRDVRVRAHRFTERAGRHRVVYVRDDRRNDADADVEDESDDDEAEARPLARIRVKVEGLPVPVIDGSRVTEARIETPEPPAPPDPPRPPAAPRPPKPPKHSFHPTPAVADEGPELKVTGRLSATDARARKDARARLEEVLGERLEPDVPRSWKVPAAMVDGLIKNSSVAVRPRDYGRMYEATLTIDLSPAKRARIVAAYHHELVMNRLAALGGLLTFVLVCLATVSGYIRADEATKGYYTTRLRLAAAAGVGAAGVLIYQMIT